MLAKPLAACTHLSSTVSQLLEPQVQKIAVFTYRSPHFCFPWRRPSDYHAICSTDGKTIQCLPNTSQHVPVIYMTCALIMLVVIMFRGIKSKDEQGNDSIIATRRSRQHHSNLNLRPIGLRQQLNSSQQSRTIKDARRCYRQLPQQQQQQQQQQLRDSTGKLFKVMIVSL